MKKRRDGFVLLTTLVVIALAGFLLAGIARRSLLRAMETVSAQEDLQQRWALASLRRSLLPYAEEILQAQAMQADEDDGEVESQLNLVCSSNWLKRIMRSR